MASSKKRDGSTASCVEEKVPKDANDIGEHGMFQGYVAGIQ